MEAFYFIGTKGSGMSSLAHILLDLGHQVKGSDIEDYVFTQVGLENKNITIEKFGEEKLSGDCTYIIGNAFNKENNKLVNEVIQGGYKHFYYHDFLGRLSLKKKSVGISGVHGKTSTTSLMAHLLDQMTGANYLIGDGNGKGVKNSPYFVFEACEYRNHFLKYRPFYGIITNIDFDHPDFFKNERQVLASFTEYVKNVRKKVLVYGDDQKYKDLNVREISKIVTYGFGDENEFQAKNLKQDTDGITYDFCYRGEKIQRVSFPVFGKHNALNSLAVLGIFYLENLDLSNVNEFAKTYEGAKRGFQTEELEGFTIVNDYAHHPIEIEATIEAARQKFPKKRVVAIFQPHTYTRTAMFEQEFKVALSKADFVYGCEIFGSAREEMGETSIEHLLEGIENSDILRSENIKYLTKEKDSVLLFMGAGDIEKYIKNFKEVL